MGHGSHVNIRGDMLELVAFLLPGAVELGLHSQRVDVGELRTTSSAAVWFLKTETPWAHERMMLVVANLSSYCKFHITKRNWGEDVR